jgi:DeoR family suf operon transcriptional repressor
MSKKATSTKEEILDLLKRHKKLTVADLAKHLGITEMAVRRHLNTLERDYIVETAIVRQAMGRPTHVYSLTVTGEEMFPRNYAKLSIDFLHDIEDLSGKTVVNELFNRRKERMKESYQDVLEGKTFEEKISTLAKIQNNNGYMVEWEKDTDGSYIFKEYNCPISQIAKEYPVACECEQELFKELLNTEEIECEACMATEDVPHCYYKIKEPN